MLYHEKQVAALCGVHCLNTLLQGPFFTEVELAQIGLELDALEREVLQGAALDGASGNVDEGGMFSIQVLSKALQVWNIQVVPYDNQELQAAGFDPQNEVAFVCNLQEHWFTIRNIDGEWWNFNSLFPAPEHLSKFYLTAFLDSLKEQGYTIFVVRGELPRRQHDNGGDLDGPGRWFTPEEARSAHAEAADARQRSRVNNTLENVLARAQAGGGTITLQPRRPVAMQQAAGDVGADEDEDLAAAIAASLEDHTGGAGSAGGVAQAAPLGAAGAGPSHTGGAGGDGFVADDDDPELAAALAASLEDVQRPAAAVAEADAMAEAALPAAAGAAAACTANRGAGAEAAVAVPEEPAAGPGVVHVGLRLPNGERIMRRFSIGDSVSVLCAYAQQQLPGGGRVELSTQFPRKVLQPQETLEAAGVQDRSTLNVAVLGR